MTRTTPPADDRPAADQAVHPAASRRDYDGGRLDEAAISRDPLTVAQAWFAHAVDSAPAGWIEPHAFTLATVDTTSNPDARTVLAKSLGPSGIRFYTHDSSAKGRQIAGNPQAAGLFYWGWLDRQLRVRGSVSRIDEAAADAYWATRPRASQAASAASRQSAILDNVADFSGAASALEKGNNPIARPASWHGFDLALDVIEFWQGRPARAHERIRVVRSADGTWDAGRLYP